ncbi:MAG: TonB-dependent receptor, partial [Parvibaculales bacterium]
MMRRIIFSLLLCISQPIWAGEREEIIVLGDKLPSPALDNPYGAIVITREEMEGYQVSFLQDILTKTGVADFYQSGGKGTFSDIYLRGLGSKYVKLLYDGIILNNPYSQQAAFSHLASGGLSHIEIVKGSEGVLYGSETIGGAIHAHSAIGGEGSGQFSHEVGSFATQNSRLSLQGERGDIAYGLGAGFYQTKGFSALD